MRRRLGDAEDALHAIRAGDVDAVVASGMGNDRVITLAGTDLPYRVLLDQMFAGAVTLTLDGIVLYSNRRFSDIVGSSLPRLVGSGLRRFVRPAERTVLTALLERGSRERVRGELCLRVRGGADLPVDVTFAPLRLPGSAEASAVIGVVVDATERKQQEALRTRLIEQVMGAQDQERSRIARELHDETGQSLTALLVGLRALEESPTVAEATVRARQLRELAARTLDDVGRLARGLHPGVLDDLGLAVAMNRQVTEFTRLYGIAADIRIEGLGSGPTLPVLQNTVYRVLQEALTNIARHAKARRVSVRLARNDRMIELRVRDDGVGFAPGTLRRGLGLKGMRERAALLGGVLQLESTQGKGTVITARLPLVRS